MAMRGSISGSSGNIGGVITKNTGNVFSGSTDGYWIRGLNAYQVALNEGFQGTVQEWLASLKGESVTVASIREYGDYVHITFSDGKSFDLNNSSAIVFNVNAQNQIYWKYKNEPNDRWRLLVDINSIVNAQITESTMKFASIQYDTTENWNSRVNLVSEIGTIYYYEDYFQEIDDQGNTITRPGIKIGDGMAYLIDLPFINSQGNIDEHINNKSVHITEAERLFWNNKCRVDESYIDNENLIFSIH